MQNCGKLAGKTIFITGASRGIGKAIALKCAQDGGNIVIVAKTAQPHPKLPGTIFTAAEEIQKAGGQCLPCEVDIRDESQVKRAAAEAVAKFGGIDILVNNASAISITGTVDTEMKKYDLMNSVNVRGTFLCSKYCVPYLKKSKNPHILNISPPLNMNPVWFKSQVAYTMAKYGMSMCVLGMAEEFKADGIAVNALWPRTAIYTAAMEMLGGGAGIRSSCRKPDIMADAAYAMLCRESRTFTGQFCIDEDVLKAEGVTDFDNYSYEKNAKLMPDFFLDITNPEEFLSAIGGAVGGGGVSGSKPATKTSDADVAKTMKAIQAIISPEHVKSIGAIFQFDLKDAGVFFLDLKNGTGSLHEGSHPDKQKPDATFTMSGSDFVQMFFGKIDPAAAFMSGKMKLKGDMAMAMKLQKLMKQVRSKL